MHIPRKTVSNRKDIQATWISGNDEQKTLMDNVYGQMVRKEQANRYKCIKMSGRKARSLTTVS